MSVMHDLVRQGNVVGILPMIAKKARATFFKLPYSERNGRSVEDLIADGRAFAVTRAAKQYKPTSGTKFSTYLFVALDNYYKDVLKAAYTDSRCAVLYSSDSTTIKGTDLTLDKFIKKSRLDRMEDRLIDRIDAERGFFVAYARGNPMMRKFLIRMILQPGNQKITASDENMSWAGDALKDFRQQLLIILPERCIRAIQTDYHCRVNIANSLFGMFQTPVASIQKATKLSQTRERDLVPLLSAARQRSLKVFEEVRA